MREFVKSYAKHEKDENDPANSNYAARLIKILSYFKFNFSAARRFNKINDRCYITPIYISPYRPNISGTLIISFHHVISNNALNKRIITA